MGVYSMMNTGTSTVLEGFDFDAVVESAETPDLAGAYAIVAQNEANFNAIMKAVGIQELSVLESTGQEMIYEAVDIKGFFGKIKDFFLSILKKIAGLVKRFFAMVDQYAKDDKDFVKKYKSDLLALKNLSDFEYSGYKFTNLKTWNASEAYQKMTSETEKFIGSKAATLESLEPVIEVKDVKDEDIKVLNDAIEKLQDDDGLHDTLRGAALLKSDKIESDEFAEEVFKYFHDGETSKTDLSSIDPSDLMRTLLGTENMKKEAKKSYDNIEKTVKGLISKLDKIEAKILKMVPGKDNTEVNKQQYFSKAVSVTSKASATAKTTLNIITQVNGALLSAIKSENRQARAICVKLMAYKPKKEGFEHYTEGSSFLDGVVLK